MIDRLVKLLKRNVVWVGGAVLLMLVGLGYLCNPDRLEPPTTPPGTSDTILVPGLRDTILIGPKTTWRDRIVEKIRTVELPADTVYLEPGITDTLPRSGYLYEWGMLEVEKDGRRLTISSVQPFDGGGAARKVFTLPQKSSDFAVRANETSGTVKVGRLDRYGVDFGAEASMSLGFNNISAVGVGVVEGPIRLRAKGVQLTPSVIGTTNGEYGVGVTLRYSIGGF